VVQTWAEFLVCKEFMVPIWAEFLVCKEFMVPIWATLYEYVSSTLNQMIRFVTRFGELPDQIS
jgi:hypothetical protein